MVHGMLKNRKVEGMRNTEYGIRNHKFRIPHSVFRLLPHPVKTSSIRRQQLHTHYLAALAHEL